MMFRPRYFQLITKSIGKQKKLSSNIAFKHETSLLKHLQAKIKFSGPLTINEYMKEVLTNPISGYYMKKNVFGAKGDFITSPEISQMFGELLGVWIYNEWQKMGSPKPFQLIEFGPGTGSLMQDVLRTFKKLNLGSNDFEIHLIEKSLFMSNIQEETLTGKSTHKIESVPDDLRSTYKTAHTSLEVRIHWHYHLEDVPKGFSMVFAHEFFDALPIHKLKRTDEGWREVLIDISESSSGTDEGLRYVISRGPTPASKLYVDEDEKRNDVEVSPESGILMQQLSKRLKENGGAVLIVDYGHNGTCGDTFRAFRNHEQVSPLVSPGDSDLTADVNFAYLQKHAEEKLVSYGPVTQGFFLKNMGIEVRLQKLLQNSDPSQYKSLITGYKMLVEPQHMGERFKVMTFLPKVMKEILVKYPPAGFFRSFSKE